MVGEVRSSHRGRVEDFSDLREVRLALFDRAVGLGGCNAEHAESAYPLGFVGKKAGVVVDLRRSAIFSMQSSCDSVSVRAPRSR
eukprot:3462066-Pleurochrysis_carterae.AAC.1